jgi:hypothetical protein
MIIDPEFPTSPAQANRELRFKVGKALSTAELLELALPFCRPLTELLRCDLRAPVRLVEQAEEIEVHVTQLLGSPFGLDARVGR